MVSNMTEEQKKDWRNFTKLSACIYLFIVLMVFIKTIRGFDADNFIGSFFISLYEQSFNWFASLCVITIFNFKHQIYNYFIFFVLNTSLDLFTEKYFVNLENTRDFVLLGISLLCMVVSIVIIYLIPSIDKKLVQGGKIIKDTKRIFWTLMIIQLTLFMIGGCICYILF